MTAVFKNWIYHLGPSILNSYGSVIRWITLVSICSAVLAASHALSLCFKSSVGLNCLFILIFTMFIIALLVLKSSSVVKFILSVTEGLFFLPKWTNQMVCVCVCVCVYVCKRYIGPGGWGQMANCKTE